MKICRQIAVRLLRWTIGHEFAQATIHTADLKSGAAAVSR
jgi:hypothetical protein